MATKRMFATHVIDSDNFTDMPLSAQALYFHMAMRADDEGFLNNPRQIQRSVGATLDDLKLLITKEFIIPFDDSGVVVIRHWAVHNHIPKDRFHPTVYIEEKQHITKLDSGEYVCESGVLSLNCIQTDDKLYTSCIQTGDTMITNRKQSVYSDLDKDLDKDLNNKNKYVPTSGGNEPEKTASSASKRFKKPSVEEIRAYCRERNNNINPEQFFDFYESKGWFIGKSPMKDWRAAIRQWEQRSSGNQSKPQERVYTGGMDIERMLGINGGTA